MKKILLGAIALAYCSSAIGAEKLIGKYTLSYINKTYEVKVGDIENGKFEIFIQVSGETPRSDIYLSVESTHLEQFLQSLTQMKNKFEEWSKVAKDNNVTEMSKDMDVKFPLIHVCWYISKWYFALNQKVTPEFMVLDDGLCLSVIKKDVQSSSNEYIEESFYWIFTSSKEIDDLIAILDYDKIKSKLEQSEDTSNLFK